MTTLEQWEAEAGPQPYVIACPDGKKDCLVMHTKNFDTPEGRKIRALISLIRKKDEKLKQLRELMIEYGSPENSEEIEWIDETIKLTAEIK